MVKYLKEFPTTLDIEIFYLLSNLWWLIVFLSADGYFTGVTYQRALYYLGQDILVVALVTLVFIGLLALIQRKFVYIALISGPSTFVYFGVVSLTGMSIAFNAAIFLFIAALGIYRLFSFTYFHDYKDKL